MLKTTCCFLLLSCALFSQTIPSSEPPHDGQRVNAAAFGLRADGVGDATGAVQAAINSLGRNGGRVIIDAGEKGALIGALKFPAAAVPARWTVLEISGSITQTATWDIPDFVAVVGRGYGQGTQYQVAPGARIHPVNTKVAFHVTGPSAHYFENLTLEVSSGIGIQLDGANLTRMVNVSAIGLAPGVVPLEVKNAFWVWLEQCVFIHTADEGESIHLTGDGKVGFTGVFFMKDCRISGLGVLLDAASENGISGNFYFDGVHYENAANDFLTIEEHSTISEIGLNRIEIADARKPAYLLGVKGNAKYELGVRNVTIRDVTMSSPFLRPGTRIYGLHIDGGRTFDYSSGWGFGSEQTDFASLRFGQFDAEVLSEGAAMGPALAPPVATAPVVQDVKKWASLSGVAIVTPGIVAPDGTPTAAKLSTAVKSTQVRMPLENYAVQFHAGDWVLAGVWMKSEDAGAPPSNQGVIVTSDAITNFNGIASNQFSLMTDASYRVGAGWVPVVVAAKVTRANPQRVGLFMKLACDADHPSSYWMPWIAVIPASAGLSDPEIVRYKRHILRTVVAAMPAGGGLLSMLPWHKLYWGNDTDLYRAAAGSLKTDNKFTAAAGLNIGGGTDITRHLSASAKLNFERPESVPGCSADQTISVPGAAPGDTVSLGFAGAMPRNFSSAAFVSSSGKVAIRWCQFAGPPADPDGMSGATYRVDVWQH